MTDFSSRARRRHSAWDTTVLVLGCLMLAAAALAAYRASSELRSRRGEAARLDREAADSTAKARLLATRDGTAAAALAAQAEGTLDAPPTRVVADLSGAMPPDVRVQSLDLDYRDRILVGLRVEARSPEAYDLFLKRLSESPRFREIVPGPEKRDGDLSATVRASYRYGVSQ
jgi:hypothetical protein